MAFNIQDSSGNWWAIAVSTGGVLSTTSISSPGTTPTSTLNLVDSSGNIWKLTVSTGGILQQTLVTAAAGPGSKQLSDVITRAQNEFKGITLSTVDALDFGNEIYQIIGLATWWDWLITIGARFGTIANQQDYANVPSDFRRLSENKCWINDDSNTFSPMLPLAVRENLPKSNTRGIPRAISVENGNFRLFPVPIVTRVTSGQWAIYFEYWKMPKRLYSTSEFFEFPDQYFEVFCAGFNARVADFLHDERAGQWLGRNPENSQFAGSGMWGKFAALLNNMVREEETSSGVIVWAPEAEFQRY